MISVVCYSDERERNNSTCLEVTLRSSSGMIPFGVGLHASSADEAQKDDGYNESNKDSEFNI